MGYFVFCDVILHRCHELFIGFSHVKIKPFIAATVLPRFEPNLEATWVNTITSSTNVTAKLRTRIIVVTSHDVCISYTYKKSSYACGICGSIRTKLGTNIYRHPQNNWNVDQAWYSSFQWRHMALPVTYMCSVTDSQLLQTKHNSRRNWQEFSSEFVQK